MAQRQAMGPEDTTAITDATDRGLQAYQSAMGVLGINQMVMEFNGDKSGLAQALASTSDKSSAAYKTQMKNISRWLNYEKGERGKQARNPGNKATQARFKNLRMRMKPPKKASVTITGWIGYDNDRRWRTVGSPKPIQLSGNGLARFLSNMQAGDTHKAYREVFNAYGAPSLSVEEDPGTQMNVTFSD